MIALRLVQLSLSAFILSSCITHQPLSNSVPEEAGMQFSQLTTQEETGQILGPKVNFFYNKIQWQAQPMIGVSPDSQYVSYIAMQNGHANIYIKRSHGGTAVIQRTFKDGARSVSYSPDSKNICFADASEGNSNIYMMNAIEGAAIQQITATPMEENGPVFSADGKSIFFTKTEQSITEKKGAKIISERYYVWGYNVTTGLLTQYAEGLTPAPLPDGKRILLTRINKETRNGEIWMVDIERSTETLILSDRMKGYSSPQISPDGQSIICVGTTYRTKERPMNLDIYKVNINGTGLTQITFHPASDVSPRWSPDGKSVYFISSRGNAKKYYNLWKVNVR